MITITDTVKVFRIPVSAKNNVRSIAELLHPLSIELSDHGNLGLMAPVFRIIAIIGRLQGHCAVVGVFRERVERR